MCTALLNRALNRDQVIAVHIDNGFMRKRESQSVEEALKKLGIQVKGTAQLQQNLQASSVVWLRVLHRSFTTCSVSLSLETELIWVVECHWSHKSFLKAFFLLFYGNVLFVE